MSRAVLVLLIALCLAACGLTKGTVTDKHDIPGHYYTEDRHHVQWAQEQWTLVIKAGDKTNELSVTQAIYQKTRIGDFYNDDTKEVLPGG